MTQMSTGSRRLEAKLRGNRAPGLASFFVLLTSFKV